ncbi:MAG TPA: NADH-quinone oxidoreductase subunit L, partial [Acidimicrobiales bacterium]|nr:NADH-quinone oxidoreductase subunit L [Acidimicrobiales bacterium]
IHLYSIGYMKGDDDYPKFFVYMNLFVASMLILVLADNLVLTFVGWEGVGLCSYLLVAFWYRRSSAASAGQKAFLYNRIADVGFLIAIFLVYDKTGSVDYRVIFAHASALSPGVRTAVCLLLFMAAVGKSAQIPLFPWLADAMEGPTPVSALIHAATMVTAGVYLMCRISPLLALAHDAQLVVAALGVATALVAATIACAQQDIKKVLAYSTVSQLGYMFLAVGTGAYEAAIFLMVAHAFFKALLFLGAGSVIHGLHDEQDLKRMGNVRRYMRLTFGTFAVGWLAIAGIPPLSGFFAKGDILDNAFARYRPLWALGLVTAALTAYYMSRLMALAFYGEDRWRRAGRDAPHESPWVMAAPLLILAALAAVGGVLDAPGHPSFAPLAWLGPVFGHALYQAHQSPGTQWVLGAVDAGVALLGLGVGLGAWLRRSEQPALEPAVLQRSYYLDDIYDTVLGRPAERLATYSIVFDNRVIDGAVNAVGRLARGVGGGLRRLQTGFVRQYALGIVVGTVALLAYMMTRVS